MGRKEIILDGLNLAGLGLEIGPSFRPLLPKSSGLNIRVADHANAEELRTKYREISGASEQIETVDYVIKSTLYDAVGPETKFDYIIASHVIEHVPDLIRFLKDCENILKPNGILSLAIPDMRFCFDSARNLTSAADVIRAYDAHKTKPDRYDVLDYFLNAITKGGVYGWYQGYNGDNAVLFDSVEYAYAQSLRAESEYIDVHCWRFTPASFRLLMSDLKRFGHINLSEQNHHPTIEHEFYVTLSKSPSSSPQMKGRMEMLSEIINERQVV